MHQPQLHANHWQDLPKIAAKNDRLASERKHGIAGFMLGQNVLHRSIQRLETAPVGHWGLVSYNKRRNLYKFSKHSTPFDSTYGSFSYVKWYFKARVRSASSRQQQGSHPR